MDEAARQRYETQSKDLRVKIKAWEVEFYQSHDGKKPSRDDIKTSGMSMLPCHRPSPQTETDALLVQQTPPTKNTRNFVTSSTARSRYQHPQRRPIPTTRSPANANPPNNPPIRPPPSASEQSRRPPPATTTPSTRSHSSPPALLLP